MNRSKLKELAAQLEKQHARRRSQAKTAPSDPFQDLCAGLQAWNDAAWPEVAGEEGREPTAEERKTAKVRALLTIRQALHRLGPDIKKRLLAVPADEDPGRAYAMTLLFKVKPLDIDKELPVPRRLEYHPIYTPLDQWLSGHLRREVGKLLAKSASDESTRASKTATPTVANKRPSLKLSPREQAIVSVIQKVGRRLTTNQLISELAKTCGLVSLGSTKTSLAYLTRAKVLTNRRDTDPPGYGMPDWP
jgi:hypothetical protein